MHNYSTNFFKKNQQKGLKEFWELLESWDLIFLHPMKEHTKPLKMILNKEGGSLFVGAIGGSFLEINNIKNEIMNCVNLYFGKKIVDQIIINPIL